MTDLRKAAEMALDALHNIDQSNNYDAIQALRQALAQPDQSPLVWMNKYGHVASFQNEEYKDPLYTAPPKREWVGVTYDEVYEFVCTTDSYIDFAKAIEAKLKEKNT